MKTVIMHTDNGPVEWKFKGVPKRNTDKSLSQILQDIIEVSEESIRDFADGNEALIYNEHANMFSMSLVGKAKYNITIQDSMTGISVTADEFKSQHLNRQLAILKLIIKLNGYK